MQERLLKRHLKEAGDMRRTVRCRRWRRSSGQRQSSRALSGRILTSTTTEPPPPLKVRTLTREGSTRRAAYHRLLCQYLCFCTSKSSKVSTATLSSSLCLSMSRARVSDGTSLSYSCWSTSVNRAAFPACVLSRVCPCRMPFSSVLYFLY
jgi:hypothetical protein